MIRNLEHPSRGRLAGFIDGGLSRMGRVLVARHLGRCDRCRREVEALQDLGRLVREAPVPPPSDALLERIRDSLRASRGVEPPPDLPIRIRARRGGPGLAVSGAVLLVLAAVTLVAVVPRLEAHHATLAFSPEAPAAGESVRLTYHAGTLITGEGRVVARGRLYGPDGEWRAQRVVLEYRRLRHRYDGEVVLPDWAVYAVFAVEDRTGERVDTNQGALWDLIVHDPEGRPHLEALRERAARHYTGRLDLALEAARSMTEHHPDRPESWSTRFAVEKTLAGPDGMDALLASHRPRFNALERQFETADPSAEDIAWMAMYARDVEDAGAVERWDDRLLREAPWMRAAVQLRIGELRRELGDDPPRLVDEHSRLWDQVGPSEEIAASAFALALDIGDGSSAVLWADRNVRANPSAAPSVALRLSRLPEGRDEGTRRLRAELRRLEAPPDPDERPLGISVSEHQAERERTASRLLAARGQALLAVGRAEAAADTLALAADLRWDPEVFRAAAAAYQAQGDTISSLRYLARLVVDPGTGEGEEHVVAELPAKWLSPQDWDAEIRRAELRMREQVLARAVHRRVPRRMAVHDEEGKRGDLRSVLEDGVALVSLWYCFCAQFQANLERYVDLAREVSGLGVRVVAVVTGPGEAANQRPAEIEAAGLPVWTDIRGEVLRGFGYAGTPAYFLVDAEGVVRFAYSRPDEVLRQAFVLRQTTLARPLAPQ